MATPPTASTANSNSTTNETTITNAANQLFIDGATFAINQATTRGEFAVVINSIDGMDRIFIQNYFQGLGYKIAIPALNNGLTNPATLFGQFFNEFWVDQFMPFSFLPFFDNKQPYPVMISWN